MSLQQEITNVFVYQLSLSVLKFYLLGLGANTDLH